MQTNQTQKRHVAMHSIDYTAIATRYPLHSAYRYGAAVSHGWECRLTHPLITYPTLIPPPITNTAPKVRLFHAAGYSKDIKLQPMADTSPDGMARSGGTMALLRVAPN